MRILRVIFTFLSFLSVSLCASEATPDGASLSNLPVAAWSSISAALGRDLHDYQVHIQSGVIEINNAGNRMVADFTAAGVEVRSGKAQWQIVFSGYGDDDTLKAVVATVPHANGNRVEYQRGPVTEWYINGPLGLEQGFTINEPPGKGKGQPLTIVLGLSGEGTAMLDPDGTSLTLTSHNIPLRYSGLTAYDATGKKLRAWEELRDGKLLIKVADATARYPVVIDPWVQLAKLTASDGQPSDSFGYSLAISGNTAVVGAVAHNNGQGAAYVFVKPASGWANMTETAKLAASDGQPGDFFGNNVSISGSTVVVGAPRATGGGATYVFVKPSSSWTTMTETAKLTASQPGDSFGYSVAISGNTAVIGALNQNFGGNGAAYVFVKPVTGWINMTQTAELTASDGQTVDYFGWAVSISGNTAVVGSVNATIEFVFQGAAYVYVKPTTGWVTTSRFDAKLVSSTPHTQDALGTSVSVNGKTVVAGVPGYSTTFNYQQGAALVFVRPKKGWANMTQTAILTASGGAAGDNLGNSVGLGNGGSMVVAGAPSVTISGNQGPGAAYVFTKPKKGWKTTSHFAAKLVASDGVAKDGLGTSVAIAGNTVLAGATGATIGGNQSQGAAYVFGR
jgi:hypothetical protein